MIKDSHLDYLRCFVRSADFAFTKFSMIKKVLLVMGHWYYQRLATLIHYFFYKNLVLGNIMVSIEYRFYNFFMIQCQLEHNKITNLKLQCL